MLVASIAATAGAQPHERIDAKLQSKLEALVKGFHGDVGIYVRNLKTRSNVASVRGDELFPTASTIKVPILIGTFDSIEKGKLHLSANDDVSRLTEIFVRRYALIPARRRADSDRETHACR